MGICKTARTDHKCYESSSLYNRRNRHLGDAVRIAACGGLGGMRQTMVRGGFLALVLCLLLAAGACSGSSDDPGPVPSLALPSATPEPSPSALPPVTAAADPTLVPTSTSNPFPTPTPVPLPGVCLQPEFASDVENCGAIPYYEISLVVDPPAARVTGRQEIRYTNLEDEALDDVYLRLFPSTPGYGGTMTVTHLLVAGQVVTPVVELEGTALRLPMTPTLAVGRSITLSMDFVVDVPTTGRAGHALFAYLRGVMALPTVYPLIPVYDDEGWNVEIAPEYSDDIYSDIAAYEVQITAPSAMTLVASGSCVVQVQEAETTTWTCEAAPVRNFVLILGENFEMANRVVNDVVINSHFYPEHAQGGGRALEVAADALEAFTELFGPYPYAELDVVETPNYLGGMEYPSLVVIEDGLYPGVAGVEWLTAHEVAHQWWFGVVGSDQIDEPWLDEALTQYSTMLYYEKVYGPDRAAGILRGEFIQTHQNLLFRGRDMPAGLPAGAYGPRLYWEIVYDKGALYFHELRQAVGDESFFEILQTYYSRHRYRIATPESFLAVVESVTGDRHQDVFDAWIAESVEGNAR
jgi:hypothetical protein